MARSAVVDDPSQSRSIAVARRPADAHTDAMRYTPNERLCFYAVVVALAFAFPTTSLLLTVVPGCLAVTLLVGVVRGFRGRAVPQAKPPSIPAGPLATRPQRRFLALEPLSHAQRRVFWVAFALPVVAFSMTGGQLLLWALPLWALGRAAAALATRIRPQLAY